MIIGATGVSFTAPVFVYALIRLRVVEPEFSSKNRVIIWFLVWVVTGLFLTPDGGPLPDVVIFVPIVVLIEGAVLLARHNLGASPLERGQAPSQRARIVASSLQERISSALHAAGR
ncbi:MAG: twin-arginine translocase subunit TatC [Nitrososphaerales archaeon]